MSARPSSPGATPEPADPIPSGDLQPWPNTVDRQPRHRELAQYAERFRDKAVVIALPVGTSFGELLLDLKVLSGYRIQVALVTQDPEFRLEELIRLFVIDL